LGFFFNRDTGGFPTSRFTEITSCHRTHLFPVIHPMEVTGASDTFVDTDYPRNRKAFDNRLLSNYIMGRFELGVCTRRSRFRHDRNPIAHEELKETAEMTYFRLLSSSGRAKRNDFMKHENKTCRMGFFSSISCVSWVKKDVMTTYGKLMGIVGMRRAR